MFHCIIIVGPSYSICSSAKRFPPIVQICIQFWITSTPLLSFMAFIAAPPPTIVAVAILTLTHSLVAFLLTPK